MGTLGEQIEDVFFMLDRLYFNMAMYAGLQIRKNGVIIQFKINIEEHVEFTNILGELQTTPPSGRTAT